MGVWAYGYMGVWVHGCMRVWVRVTLFYIFYTDVERVSRNAIGENCFAQSSYTYVGALWMCMSVCVYVCMCVFVCLLSRSGYCTAV